MAAYQLRSLLYLTNVLAILGSERGEADGYAADPMAMFLQRTSCR
jgi:hypothetical protein